MEYCVHSFRGVWSLLKLGLVLVAFSGGIELFFKANTAKLPRSNLSFGLLIGIVWSQGKSICKVFTPLCVCVHMLSREWLSYQRYLKHMQSQKVATLEQHS